LIRAASVLETRQRSEYIQCMYKTKDKPGRFPFDVRQFALFIGSFRRSITEVVRYQGRKNNIYNTDPKSGRLIPQETNCISTNEKNIKEQTTHLQQDYPNRRTFGASHRFLHWEGTSGWLNKHEGENTHDGGGRNLIDNTRQLFWARSFDLSVSRSTVTRNQ
jgi:hypothetical protein